MTRFQQRARALLAVGLRNAPMAGGVVARVPFEDVRAVFGLRSKEHARQVVAKGQRYLREHKLNSKCAKGGK